MPIIKIVSGGQTGADRGGLEAALYCDIPHGGWCPKGRKAEDGRIPDKYTLREMETDDYIVRTEANVVDSDATVVFTERNATGNSLRTIEFCMKHGKPWHHIPLATTTREKAVQEITAWLSGDPTLNDYEEYEAAPPRNCILNVAGSRESKLQGIEEAVMRIVVDVLIAVNPNCRKYYPLPKRKTPIKSST